MNQKERWIIAGVLALVAALVGFDIITDSREGVEIWHLLVEGSLGLVSIFGIFYVLRGSYELRHQLAKTEEDRAKYKLEAEAWRAESRKFTEGLSLAIDQQLSKWNLSGAEKEVAFLLLKGLSIKEIAEIRQTAEKTVKVQSAAIYAKAGLAGRSELSAFFLEDLLVPSQPLQV